jgi:hypothetical protein
MAGGSHDPDGNPAGAGTRRPPLGVRRPAAPNAGVPLAGAEAGHRSRQGAAPLGGRALDAWYQDNDPRPFPAGDEAVAAAAWALSAALSCRSFPDNLSSIMTEADLAVEYEFVPVDVALRAAANHASYRPPSRRSGRSATPSTPPRPSPASPAAWHKSSAPTTTRPCAPWYRSGPPRHTTNVLSDLHLRPCRGHQVTEWRILHLDPFHALIIYIMSTQRRVGQLPSGLSAPLCNRRQWWRALR